MMRIPHCSNNLGKTWIVNKSSSCFVFPIYYCGNSSLFPNCLLLYYCNRLPPLVPKGFPFVFMEDFQLSPFRNFLLPSYAKAQTQFMVGLVSPPSIIKNVRYDPSIESLVDDEALM